jgi:hypothetical protein
MVAEEGTFSLLSAGFLLGLLFSPEDGGNMFLQNAGLSLNQVALHKDHIHRTGHLPNPTTTAFKPTLKQ